MLFSSIPFFILLFTACFSLLLLCAFSMEEFHSAFLQSHILFLGRTTIYFLMVLSILLGYIEGILIGRKKHSHLILAGACCIHLGLLMYFKYIDFLDWKPECNWIVYTTFPHCSANRYQLLHLSNFELSHRCVSKRLYGAEKSDFFWSICVDVPAVDRRTDRAVQRHCSTA